MKRVGGGYVVALKAFGQASRIKKGYVYDVSLTIPRCESLVLEIDSSKIKIFLAFNCLCSLSVEYSIWFAGGDVLGK